MTRAKQLEKDQSYINRPVAKQVSNSFRRGVMIGYNPPTRRWGIQYDDDSDDEIEWVKWVDLEAAIELYDTLGDDLEAAIAAHGTLPPVESEVDSGAGRRRASPSPAAGSETESEPDTHIVNGALRWHGGDKEQYLQSGLQE